MRSHSLVNRLLTASLFATSCLGTLALFGSVPMLPGVTARIAGILPDLAEFALDDLLNQPMSYQRSAWVAQMPKAHRPSVRPGYPQRSSAELLRYRLSR
jgi:hypothetical protein